jgi:hypothetical protein
MKLITKSNTGYVGYNYNKKISSKLAIYKVLKE